LGRDASSAIETAGNEYVKYQDHKEISHGAATAADLLVNLENDWNEQKKNADPNDPSVAKKFYETNVKPSLDQFKSAFTTENSQKYAEGIAEKYNQHFATKTAADMSSMAGQAAVLNAHKMINSSSSAVYNDPSSLPTVLDVMKHSVGSIVDSSPTIDAETGQKVKGELLFKGQEAAVKAAVSGMIKQNPNVDLDAVQKKYGEYLQPGEIKMFQAAAQRQAKTDASQARQDQILQKQQADLKVHQDATKVMTDNMRINPLDGKIMIDPKFFSDSLELARQNPDAPSAAATARTLLDFGDSQQNKERKIVTDQSVRQDLTDRMFSPDKPTTSLELMKAQIDGKLSDHDFTTMDRMVKEMAESPLKGPVWQNTLTAAKDSLIVNVPGVKGKDNVGIANYSSFLQAFVPQYQAKARAGTLPPNALDTKDPTSMISQALQPYQRNMADRMRDYTTMFGGIGATEPGASEPKKPAQQSRMVGDVPVPVALNGVASLQFNKAKGLWRDQSSGTIYDAKGNPVKQ
jgi:hypothetical protein